MMGSNGQHQEVLRREMSQGRTPHIEGESELEPGGGSGPQGPPPLKFQGVGDGLGLWSVGQGQRECSPLSSIGMCGDSELCGGWTGTLGRQQSK